MNRVEMERLIGQHLSVECAGDAAGRVVMYTDDVVHDVVDAPHGSLQDRQSMPVCIFVPA